MPHVRPPAVRILSVIVTVVLASALGGATPWLADPVAPAGDLVAASLRADPADLAGSAIPALAAQHSHAGGLSAEALRVAAERYQYVQRVLPAGAGPVWAIAADPGGHHLYTSGEDGFLRAFEVNTGRQVGAAEHLAAPLQVLAFDPVRGFLAGGDSFGGVWLWLCDGSGVPRGPLELSSSDPRQRLAGVVSLTFHSGLLISMSQSRAIGVWRVGIRDRIAEANDLGGRSFGEQGDWVTAAVPFDEALHGPAHLLVATGLSGIYTLDVDASHDDYTAEARLRISSADLGDRPQQLAAAGQTIAVGTTGGTQLWDAHTFHQVLKYAAGRATAPESLTFASRGQLLAIGTDQGVLLMTAAGPEVGAVHPDRTFPASATAIVAYDGDLFAAATAGTVWLVTTGHSGLALPSAPATTAMVFLPDGSLLHTLQDQGNRTTKLTSDTRTFTPDASWWSDGMTFFVNDLEVGEGYVAAAGQDPNGHGALFIWDASTGKALRKLPLPGGNPDLAQSVEISDRLLVAYGGGGELVAWSLDTWEERLRVNLGPGSYMTVLDGSPPRVAVVLDGDIDSATVAGRSARQLAIVDLAAAARVRRIWPLPGIWNVAARPGGGQLAVLTQDGRLVFLDADGKPEPNAVDLHQPSSALAYSPDGRRVAILWDDGGAVVVDVTTREIIHKGFTAARGDFPVQVAWNGSGTAVAIGLATFQRGSVRPVRVEFWNLDTAAYEEFLCGLLRGVPDRSWHGMSVTDVCRGASG